MLFKVNIKCVKDEYNAPYCNVTCKTNIYVEECYENGSMTCRSGECIILCIFNIIIYMYLYSAFPRLLKALNEIDH